jgi:hypothetical protein
MSGQVTSAEVWWGVQSGMTGRFYASADQEAAERELLRAPTGSKLMRRTVVHIDEIFEGES